MKGDAGLTGVDHVGHLTGLWLPKHRSKQPQPIRSLRQRITDQTAYV